MEKQSIRFLLRVSFILMVMIIAFSREAIGAPFEPPYIPVEKPSPSATKTVGSDPADHFTTLSGALGNAQPGWLIKVKAGTYSWSDWRSTSSGTSGNEIVLEPFAPNHEVIFEIAQGQNGNIYANHVIIDGGPEKNIIFQKASGAAYANTLMRLRGDFITLSRVRVKGPTGDCAIKNTPNNAGIRTNHDSFNGEIHPANFKILNSVIEQCDHKGIYVGSANNGQIRNNIIRHTGNTGIQVNPQNPHLAVDGLVVSGNLLYENGDCADLPGHNIYLQGKTSNKDGPFDFPYGRIQNVVIKNNFLFRSERSGIHVASCGDCIVDDIKIYNNTFFDNKQYGFSLASSVADQKISLVNNIFYGNNSGPTSFDSDQLKANKGNLTDNPLFIEDNDISSSDFLKIGSGSPAIDQGFDLASEGVHQDLFGKPRPQGNGFDIGAHEYTDWDPNLDTTPPSTPSGLTAQAAGQLEAELSWSGSSDPESGLSHYNIYRDNTLIGTSDNTTFTDTGLQVNVNYKYEVSAVNAIHLESPGSTPAFYEIVDITDPPQAPPRPPGGLRLESD
jgi:hypothetical protein